MIFLDTSAAMALTNRHDRDHEDAKRAFELVWDSGEVILTHSYVLVETCALLQNRLGHGPAVEFLREANEFTVRWISPETHADAAREFEDRNSSKLSFVDIVSFLVMRQEGITQYFGFDSHFDSEGFKRVSPEE